GSAFSVSVIAQDTFNNTATSYSGTVHFTSTDSSGSASLPPNYTFNNGDNGVHTFTNATTLVTAGTRSVIATDTVSSGITGAASLMITGATATRLSVSAVSSTVAGAAFGVLVTAQDQFNNTVGGYTGTIHFTTTDTGTSTDKVLPSNYTFLATDNGSH